MLRATVKNSHANPHSCSGLQMNAEPPAPPQPQKLPPSPRVSQSPMMLPRPSECARSVPSSRNSANPPCAKRESSSRMSSYLLPPNKSVNREVTG